MLKEMKYNTIVISGGGIKGIAMLGSLQYLKNRNMLDSVDKYIGTSIGSILSLLMILGEEPSAIIVNFVTKKTFENLKSYSIVQAFQGKGLLKFEKLQALLDDYILKKFENIPTLAELYEKYPKKLYCITFNYTQNREEILSVDTYPDMLVTDAIRMSSNVPIIFENFTYNDCLYFDGFIANNFPIHLLDKNDICLGIQTRWEDTKEKDSNNWKIFWNLFLVPLAKIQDLKNEPFLNQTNIISINLQNYSLFDFKISITLMLDLFSEGFSAAKEVIS
jgi:predicted acylesterase/phospholipase RssA